MGFKKFKMLNIIKKFFTIFLIFYSSVLFGETILVYKWKINGSEYFSKNGIEEEKILRKYSRNGFLTIKYIEETKDYTDQILVSYWKDPITKISYFSEDDFLYGIADFEFIKIIKKNGMSDYLRISAFWGGMLGEFYTGLIKPFDSSKIGKNDFEKINIPTSLKGLSSWDKSYLTGETTQGGGTVQLTFDKNWSKFANSNNLSITQTVTEIVAVIKKIGYNIEAPKTIINTPAKGEVDITGGRINGTVIGNINPKDGTFITLKAGYTNKTGKLILHSGINEFESIFKTSDEMEEDTVLILPPNMGKDNQILTTNGKGNLFWTNKNNEEINIINAGTEGIGIFDSKSNNNYLFKNIAPKSEKINISLYNKNIFIDVNENNINRKNLSGTQSASTISDFQETVLENPNVFLSNTTANSPPSSNDDISKGYSIGSLWINQKTKMIYICTNSTSGIAEWKEITQNFNDFLIKTNNLSDLTDISIAKTNLGLSNVQNIKNNFNADRDPNSNDDLSLEYSIGSIWINTSNKKRTFICIKNTKGMAIWQLLTSNLYSGFSMSNYKYINSNISSWN